MNCATATHLYLDIETVPSFDNTIIDEIRAKHVVAGPDLASIRAAMGEWEEAQGKSDAACDEAIRKLSLDATTGHIACVSFAIDDGDIDNVQNAALGLFSRPKVIVAGDGSGLSPGDTIRIAPAHSIVIEKERAMLTELFAKIENAIAAAAEGILIARYQYMTSTLTSHGAIASRVVGERDEFIRESLKYGPLRVVQPIVTAHHAPFDIRFIWQRAIILGVRPPHWWPHDAKPWDREAIDDTMTAWAGQGNRIGLDRLCRALGIPGKDGFDGSMVWDAVQTGRINEVVDYCDGDVERLRAVHRRIRGIEAQAPVAAAAE
jgi:hypothetical protein